MTAQVVHELPAVPQNSALSPRWHSPLGLQHPMQLVASQTGGAPRQLTKLIALISKQMRIVRGLTLRRAIVCKLSPSRSSLNAEGTQSGPLGRQRRELTQGCFIKPRHEEFVSNPG